MTPIKDILNELAEAFERYRNDPNFIKEYEYYQKQFTGRPNPLYFCANLTKRCGGAKIYLKREDLNHLGAHKVNNTIGQILLAKRMGKKKIIAETGAGQHGVATAATAALMGMECTIHMGAVDVERQKLNVFRMQMMGAKVVPAESGQKTLKEAVDEALMSWVQDARNTYYLLGSAVVHACCHTWQGVLPQTRGSPVTCSMMGLPLVSNAGTFLVSPPI